MKKSRPLLSERSGRECNNVNWIKFGSIKKYSPLSHHNLMRQYAPRPAPEAGLCCRRGRNWLQSPADPHPSYCKCFTADSSDIGLKLCTGRRWFYDSLAKTKQKSIFEVKLYIYKDYSYIYIHYVICNTFR